MKTWIVPATVAAFVIGLAAGVSARRTIVQPPPEKLPVCRETSAVSGMAPTASPGDLAKIEDPTSNGPSLIPWPEPSAGQEVSAKLDMIRGLAGRLPSEALIVPLWEVVWYNRDLEWKVYKLSKNCRNPATLEALIDVLDNIEDTDLREEVLASMQAEEDPPRRRFLAGLLGAAYQEPEFLKAAVEFLDDSDPEVVRSALRGIKLDRFEHEEDRQRAAGLIRAAARQVESLPLRAQALKSLAGSRDVEDVRFLVDVVERERHPECLQSAVWGLYGIDFRQFDDESPGNEVMRLMYRIASDESRPLDLRRSAAHCAQKAGGGASKDCLQPLERAYLSKLTGERQ